MPKFTKLRSYRPTGLEVGIFAKGAKRQIRITGERSFFDATESKTGSNKTDWKVLWQNEKWILKKGASILDANLGETIYLMINKREKRQFRIYPDDFTKRDLSAMLGALKSDAGVKGGRNNTKRK